MLWQTVVLIGLAGGVLLGIPLARASHKAKPLLSGLGQFFHYLASTAVAGVPIAVLAGLVMHLGRGVLLVALGFILSAFVLLVLHAIPERAATKAG